MAMGNVLRVDTFTASETRGRFARLCVQIGVEKPLITTIMIGKLEQSVTYEGMHRLCFGCGRVGHRQENCLYVIRQGQLCKAAMKDGSGDMGVSSHDVCAADNPRTKVGTSSLVHDFEQEVVHEGCRRRGREQLENRRAFVRPPAVGMLLRARGPLEAPLDNCVVRVVL